MEYAIHPVFIPLITFAVSFFTSMGGVSGAFVLLPFSVSVLGITAPSVSATNQLYNIIAIPGGVYRYIRDKKMLWKLAWIIILGTLPGVFAGVIIRIEYLPDPTDFKFFAGLVLLYIGINLLKSLFSKQSISKSKNNSSPVESVNFTLRKLSFSFGDESYSVNNLFVFIISLVVGIVGGIYGIGGGAIIAPFLIVAFRLPVYTISGAALTGTLVTSVTAVIYFSFLSLYYPEMDISPDWTLGVLYGIGGLAGTYLGARFQKHFPERFIKSVLTATILFIAAKYIWDFLK